MRIKTCLLQEKKKREQTTNTLKREDQKLTEGKGGVGGKGGLL